MAVASHVARIAGVEDQAFDPVSPPPELLARFDAYVKKTGISKTFVIEKALEKYLDENEKQ